MSTPSINISLTPASHDISVQLISELLGNNWWKFVSGTAAPSGPGAILGAIFQTVDIALLMYVSAIMMYTAFVGGLATAHEGVPLGKRYHSVWAPLRGPATWFMLFPLPWAKGLAMIQVIMLVATYWGIGVADDVWSAFVQEIPHYGGMLIPYQGSQVKEQNFVEQALLEAVAQQYVIANGNNPMSAKWIWVGSSYSGRWIYGVTPKSNPTPSGIQYGLGTVQFRCSSDMTSVGVTASNSGFMGTVSNFWSDSVQFVKNAFNSMNGTPQITAKNSTMCQQEMSDVNTLLFGQAQAPSSGFGQNGLVAYAKQITKMNAQSNGGPPSAAELANFVKIYQATQGELYTAANAYDGQLYQQQIKSFSTTAGNLGWASSAFFWWTLTNINAQANSQIMDLHATVSLPDKKTVEGYVGSLYQPYISATMGLLDKYQSEMNAQSAAAQSGVDTGLAQGVAEIGSLSSSGPSWEGKDLMELPGALTSGNPLVNVAEYGKKLQGWGVDVLSVGVGTKIVAYGAASVGTVLGTATDGVDAGTGSFAGYVAGHALGKAVIGSIADAASSLGSLAFPLGVMMVVEGATLHYVFPALPGIIMMVSVVAWLFLVVELIVACVLWAAAHVFAEGEGFSPPQAQYGYSAAIGIIFRPLLLTLSFIFVFFIIDIGGWFMGSALAIMLNGMGGMHIGLIGLAATFAVVISAVFMFIKTALKRLTQLADHAPQWMGGHSGQGLGEGDIAQGAIQNAGGGAQKYGMYAGDKMGAGMDAMASNAGSRSRKAEKEQERLERNDQKAATTGNNGGQAAPQDGVVQEPPEPETPTSPRK